MQKRGFFPLILTVLIIGFTVAIAAIEITWGGSFMAKTTEETEVTSRTIVKCCSGFDQQTGSERGGIRCSGDEVWKDGHFVSPVDCGTLCCEGGRYQMSPACAGQSYYCCTAREFGIEHSEYDKDCPGEHSCWSTFAEVVSGEIWMNGERIRMAGEGCYALISSGFTGWDSPYRILDVFRTLAGEKLIYIRASFSGPHDEGPEYVLPVWRDDRERYLSVLEDIIDYAKSKNIYIVADLNHEVHGWFENEVGEPDGAILNTSSRSYALYMEYVTSIVERFKDESYILAWETINEPNLIPGWGTNGVEFCRQVYESIKAVDSNHMVFHGFDGPSISRTMLDAIGIDHMDALSSHSYNQFVYDDYGGYSCSLTDEQREAAWDAYFSELSGARIDYNLPVINTEIGSVCPEGIMDDPNNTGPESPNSPKLWNLIWSKFKQYDIDMMNGWTFIWFSEDWKKTTYYQELRKTIFDVNPLPSGVDVPSNGKH